MKATILDTKTGRIATQDGPRSWEWAENNYSCDCNRIRSFPVDIDRYHICMGCKRFIVIKAEMNDPDDYEYTLAELNADYPDELLRKHGVIT